MVSSVNFLILIGVSGSGKTTIGKKLATCLGWDFYDADDYHPPANIDKMTHGVPLTDDDRAPWLYKLQQLIENNIKENKPGILACSALKKSYRQTLTAGYDGIKIVYLKGDYDLILSRMGNRSGHYMKSNMLESQFNILEEPQNALLVNIDQSIDQIVKFIVHSLAIFL